MTPAAFAVPGDINANTGGYIYARRLLEFFPAHDIDARLITLPGAFPYPDAAAAQQAARQLAAIEPDRIVLADGLAWGAMPRKAIEACRAPVVVLCHHPLCLETGLSSEQQRIFFDSEKLALGCARHVIASSATTRTTLIDEFAVPARRITIAEPGTARAPRAAGSGSQQVHVLAIGSVIERKGFDVLVNALAAVPDGDWRLTIAGSLNRAPETAEALRALIASNGLTGRVTLAGEVSEEAIAAAYDSADVFVLSSHYEGYGMVLAEAMARGLPIVSTTGGAAAATVPDGAALKVPPGDPAAMAQALRRMLGDRALRARMAQASWQAGQQLPDWNKTTGIIAQVLHNIAVLKS